MKKTLLFLFVMFAIHQIKAQEIILTFEGVNEETMENAPLDRVIIDNLTSGKKIELSEPYTINLTSAVATGVYNVEQEKSEQGFQNVFPNPFNDFLNVDFHSQGMGITDVSIYNIKGQKIVSFTRHMERGTHRLVFTPKENGIYIVGLIDNGNKYYSKVIASQNSNREPSLRYSNKVESSSVQSQKVHLKSGNLFYNIGDVLKYSGYSGSKTNTVYASPILSGTTTFRFTNPYYRFEPYLIEANIPNFVDIMFSVTDSLNKGVDYLTDSLFKVYEDDKEVSPTETFMYVKKLNQVPFKQKTVIMLDNSASVTPNLVQIKSAAISLVNKIATNQEIAVYSFSDNAVLLQDFSSDVSLLEAAINGINTGFPSTNLYGSLITGLNSFKNTYSLDSIAEGYLIALTDGDDTQGSSTLQQVITERGNKRVFMVGLGKELDSIPLMNIASTGAYLPATTISDLNASFDQIHLDIIRFSNSFYWLNYMSPKRNGTHTLTLEVDNNTNLNSDNNINGSFSANGFQSVFSGVYANITADKLYGLDWVNLADGELSSMLKATSYWAKDVPEYAWKNDRPSVVTMNVNSSDSSKISLTGWSASPSEVATITVTDVPNNFTKEIEVFSNSGSPRVYTKNVTDITNTSATVGALAVPGKNNNPTIKKRGIKLDDRPFQANFQTEVSEDLGVGKYAISLSDLIANTTYYIQGFISTSDGQKKIDNQTKSFKTLPGLPYFSNISDFDYKQGKKTRTSAYLRTILANDGGDPILEKGFVYSTNPNPTLATASKVTNTDTLDANGSFESNITGLTPDIDYYARGYATNNFGTAYSYELKFRTAVARVPYLKTSYGSKLPTSIESGGEIIYDGGSTITNRGVCWSTRTNPTISLTTKTTDGAGSGNFTSTLSTLQPNTTYHFRAYATNATGTGYGDERTLTTPKDLPTISTMPVTNITSKNGVYATANSGITITSDGGSTELMYYGICWDTVPNPTISGRKTEGATNNHPFKGEFAYSMNNLELGTTYYVRAYLTNEIGTTYGNELTFKPLGLPYVIINPITTPVNDEGTKITGHIWGEGGLPITEKGVCWSTSPNPTIALNTKTLEGSGTGGKYYYSNINGPFVLGATYYVRCYATNQFGTGYSNEVTFIPKGLATVTTTPITNITINGATSGGTVISDGGYSVSRGICWGTSPNPTARQQDIFKSSDGFGTGSFTSISQIYKLNVEPGTIVYVRSYAKNQAGIAYGNEVTFNTIIPNCGTVTDIDGNVYPSITIRDQCWMQKNLDVSHYRNGDVIPQVTDPAQWANLTTGAWCYYENNSAIGTTYGKLYNWYAVNDPRGLAPKGWHVASNSEWITLRDNLSYVQDWSKEGAGDRLKETGTVHWENPNTATNVSGFTGLPGGSVNSGGFSGLRKQAYFWTSTSVGNANSNVANLSSSSGVGSFSNSKSYGFSVRCIKDNPNALPTITTAFRIEITPNTATSGGTIPFENGNSITSRGVCWSTSPNPVVSDYKTIDGGGIGTFVSKLTGLTPGTLYYVRAYATNNNGTNYGDEFNFATDPLLNCDDTTTPYSSVVIGNQTWMKENLNVCTYRNGDPIPQVTDPTEWISLTTGAWCYYELNTTNGPVYGKLYNWYAVNDPRGLAPMGWHIPSKIEWSNLINFLGGETVAGGKMKQAGTEHWLNPNTDANNSSGFTGLPGGRCHGSFSRIGESACWWSSTANGEYPWYCLLSHSNASAFIYGNSKSQGFSVRCIKD